MRKWIKVLLALAAVAAALTAVLAELHLDREREKKNWMRSYYRRMRIQSLSMFLLNPKLHRKKMSFWHKRQD